MAVACQDDRGWNDFFGNQPMQTNKILELKGFLPNVCEWTQSFLTGRTAGLQIGDRTSEIFEIGNGTLQGLPLSPILSALYTLPLLDITERWTHKDLTLYVDDGAIYATSATMMAAAAKAHEGLMQSITWLAHNKREFSNSSILRWVS